MRRLTDKEVLHAFTDTLDNLHRLDPVDLDLLAGELQTLQDIHRLFRRYKSAPLAIAEL